MKFSCIKKDLERGLNITGLFVGKNLDLPVLSCIILENKKNFLNIRATNINTACEYKINIKSKEEGIVAVNSEVLYKTITNIEEEHIDLEIKNNILYLKTSSVDIKINTFDYSDFPSIPKIEDQKKNEDTAGINLPKTSFLNGLSATHYAASRSNIKPELSSIFIDFGLKKTIFVATDGFRMAEKTIIQNDYDKAQVLLPLESAEQFIKLLSNLEDDSIKIFVFKNQLFLQNSNFTVFSRLTNGDFVDYKKLIPTENETSLVFLKQDFINTSKLVNIFANDFNQIKILVKNKKVVLSTKNKKGNNNTTIPATIKGNNIDMDFNHKYILDALPAINTDSVEFVFNPQKPLIIKPVGDQSFQYIVMPLSK